MKNNFIRNKKAIICSVVVLIIAVSAILYYSYKAEQLKQSKINSYVTEISDKYSTFEAEEQREQKLAYLSTIITDYDNYKEEKSNYVEINNEYESKIEEMKNWFIQNYNQSIESNTLLEIENIEDKVIFAERKAALESLLVTINNEQIVLTLVEETINDYTNRINALNNSYIERIAAIEEAERKAEEERLEAERLEAERLAREEAERKAQEAINQSSSNNTTNSNSGNSGSSSNNNAGSSNNATTSNIPGASTHMGQTWQLWTGEVDGRSFKVYTWQNGDTYDYYTGEYLHNGRW